MSLDDPWDGTARDTLVERGFSWMDVQKCKKILLEMQKKKKKSKTILLLC